METYTCEFAGEIIDASLYDAIDFGTDGGKIEYLSFELTDVGLVVTRLKEGGSITIKNWADKQFTIDGQTYEVKQLSSGTTSFDNGDALTMYIGDNGVNTITSTNGTRTIIEGLAGDDVITLIASDNNKVYGGVGTDVVTDIGGSTNTVDTGADNDVVRSFNSNTMTISGGAGNDVLTVYGGNNTTMSGGAGDDTYKYLTKLTENTNIIIDQSDAADGDNDRLILSKISKSDVSYVLDGNNLVITNGNGGTVTINDWKEHGLNKIIFKDGVITQENVNTDLNKVTQLEVIKSFMSSLNNTTKAGFAAVNEAVVACSNGLYSSLSDLISAYKQDVLAHSGSTIEEQEKFLQDYCGINLENDDTGAITGRDAGGNLVKTAESVVDEPNGITVADFTYDTSKFATITANDYSIYVNGQSGAVEQKNFYAADVKGITFYWDESNWKSLGTDTSVLQQIIGGVLNAWGEAALNLGEESYGLTLDDATSTLKTLDNGNKGMQIYLTNEPESDFLAEVWSNRYYYNPEITIETNEVLVINTAYYKNAITDINGNSSAGQEYLDRTIAHEMVHGLMAANINSFDELPSFLIEGLAELVHGADDVRKSEILNLTNTAYSGTWTTTSGVSETYNLAGLIDAVFNQSDANASMGNETYGGGYLLMRYLAKQVSEKTTKQEIVDTPTYASGTVDTNGNMYVSATGTYTVTEAVKGLVFECSGWNAKLENWTNAIDIDFAAYKKAGLNIALHFQNNSTTCSLEILDVSDKKNYTVLGTIDYSDCSASEFFAFYADLLKKETGTTIYYGVVGGGEANVPEVNNIIAITGTMNYEQDLNNTQIYNCQNRDNTYVINGNGNSLTDRNMVSGYDVKGGNDTYIINGDGNSISDYGGGIDTFIVDWSKLNTTTSQATDGSDLFLHANGYGDGVHAYDTLTINNANYEDMTFIILDDRYLLIKDENHDGIRVYDWENSEIGTIIINNGSTTTTLTASDVEEQMEKHYREPVITEAGEYTLDDYTEFVDLQINGAGWQVTLNDYNESSIIFKVDTDVYAEGTYKFYKEAYQEGNDVVLKVHGYSNDNDDFVLGTALLKDYTSTSSEKATLCLITYSSSNPSLISSGANTVFYPQYYNHLIENDKDDAYVKYVGSNCRITDFGQRFSADVTGNSNQIEGYCWSDQDSDDVFLVQGNDNTIVAGTGNDSITVVGNRNSVMAGTGADTIVSNGSNSIDANEGNDLMYSLSNNNVLSGGAGLDTYVVDWSSANGVTITDTKESANILQIVDGSGVSVSKSADGTSLLLTDATQTLAISDVDSISAIEFLGESSKKTYNMASALASIGTAALSFDTGLTGFATISDMTEDDKNHLSVVTSNKA